MNASLQGHSTHAEGVEVKGATMLIVVGHVLVTWSTSKRQKEYMIVNEEVQSTFRCKKVMRVK